jgi:hypothetical protein
MAAAAAMGFGAAGGPGGGNPFAAAAAAAAQAHAAAVHQHAHVQHQQAQAYAAHEAMMRSTAAAAAALGMSGNSMDPAAATAMNLAQRQHSLAAMLQGAVVGGGAGAGGPPRDFEAAAAAQAAAEAAAPGACEGITLAPGSSPTAGGPGTGGARSGFANALAREASFGAGGGHTLLHHLSGHGGGSHKRQKLDHGSGHHAPLKRTQLPAAVPMPDLPEAPTRLVGDLLLGTLGDVLGKVFVMKPSLGPAPADGGEGGVNGVNGNGSHELHRQGSGGNGSGGGSGHISSSSLEAAAEGRERLMSLSEEVTRWLPDLTSVEDDSPVGGGRATREPTVDRTALTAELDSVFVAAKAAESTWKRYTEAHIRAQGGATRARNAAAQCEVARAELAGAKMAHDAMGGNGDMVQGLIADKIARASEMVASLQAVVAEATATEAEARGQAATAGRAFRPPYEEVRKRALRLRLAAEERAERQIGRALSRAERDLQNKTAKLKDLRERSAAAAAAGGGGDEDDANVTPGGSKLAELERRYKIATAGMKVIREAAEGAKTAIEWSKTAISNLVAGGFGGP